MRMIEMTEIAESMQRILQQAADDIKRNHERARQVASGRTRDSIRVEVVGGISEVTGMIWGRKYFAALETGSKPWKKQYNHPPKPFVETIRQWMDDKGIEGSAYLTARKIMREGTSLYRQGGRKDVFTPVMETIEEEIQEEISNIFTTIITETIIQ